MMKKITAAITAVGGFVPEDKLTNFDLEKWWIRMMNGSVQELAFLNEGY